jgi:hypothetical protein
MASFKRKHSKPVTVNTTRGRTEFPTCRYNRFSPVNSTGPSPKPTPSKASSSSPFVTLRDDFKLGGYTRYAPYLLVQYMKSSFRCELVKGIICKLAMELLSDHLPLQDVVKLCSLLRGSPDGFSERSYNLDEVTAIVRVCREMGLGALNELEADYENERIEGWWVDSACAEDLEREPLDRDVWAIGRVGLLVDGEGEQGQSGLAAMGVSRYRAKGKFD